MVDIREAVKTAIQFMCDIYDEGDRPKLGVDEVEHDADNGHWLVTVGIGGAEPASTMSVVEGTGVERHFKVIRIDAASGAVVAMTNSHG